MNFEQQYIEELNMKQKELIKENILNGKKYPSL